MEPNFENLKKNMLKTMDINLKLIKSVKKCKEKSIYMQQSA